MKRPIIALLATLLAGSLAGNNVFADTPDNEPSDYSCAPVYFGRNWAGRALTIEGNGTVGIRELALAVAKAYSNNGFATDMTIDFFSRTPPALPSGDEAEETDFADYQPRKGYLAIGSMGDGDFITYCFWKRNNGHLLLAVQWTKEVDCGGHVLVFYDYSPNMQLLTPDTQLTRRFERKYGRRRPDTEPHGLYSVIALLPSNGKDITVINPDTNDESIARFNGYDFD